MMRKQIEFSGLLILSILILLCFIPGLACAEQNYSVSGKNYVLPDNCDYELSKGTATDQFFYGSKSMGSLNVMGAIDKVTTYNGFTAYGTNGPVSIHYAYGGRYQYDNVDRWYVDNDGTGKVNSYGLGFLQGVGHGCIIIEKSSDGKTWGKIEGTNPKTNYFTGAKNKEESLIYSIPEDEIKNGCYYRVLVAYRFSKRTGDGFWWIGDQHEYKKCIELYTFYVCSNTNYVSFLNMGNGSKLQDGDKTATGFQISKNGSKAVVRIQGADKECNDFDCFTEPGEYIVNITTPLSQSYQSTITITDGINFTEINKTYYQSEKDKGFPLNSSVTKTIFGSPMTSLSLATPKGTEVVYSSSKYGIKGQSVSLYMKLNKDVNNLGNGCVLTADNWDKNVCGINAIGKVEKGALIIQTSHDGKTWKEISKGRYAGGLYTTDYATHYGKAQNVMIYTPSGQEILEGIHIRVLFAYQVYQQTTNVYHDYVEVYQFYLCSNELGAVTFHNLSVADTLDETFADADQNMIEVYKQAESLVDGSYTATGFQIDKKLNPTVKHTVMRNGTNISNKDNYDETGKYDITLISAVGSTRTLTIYVDRLTPEEAMKQYFGEGFISGKRIFSEGEYPVYEGGEFSYHVAGVDSNVLPLYGQISNLNTGSVITIDQTPDEKTGIITEPGEYQATFATSEKVFTGDLAGDARVFTFHFRVIAQGTAPGPAVNQKLLSDYSHSTVTDCNPIYYGLTYSSAEKGKITLAFASKEAAVKYAYEYEKGMVEKQEEGKYRYNGSFVVDQNIKYDSTWDLTDAVNYFAEAAVHKHYFDMSDEFTYLSMKQEDIESHQNLRQLELPRSITIFADGQKEELTETGALPLLNDKPYAHLDPDTGVEERGFYSFEFVTDQYGGIDSKNVTITDSNGGQHAIRYSESVGQQLLADQCPSGIVTIREETMYGDAAEYQAVYIAPGENQTELTLEYTNDEDAKTAVYQGADKEPHITADAFTIKTLSDPLDPYVLVVVRHYQTEYMYTAKDTIDTVWSEPGEYRITCLNRMGYGYTVPVTINGTAETIVEEQITPEISTQPASTVQPNNNTKEAKDDSTAEESRQSTSLDVEEKQTAAPTEQITEEKKTEDNQPPVIIVIVAALFLIAALIFAYRRVRLFSRVSENMKSEEDEKHE